jgi:hypothetical protein
MARTPGPDVEMPGLISGPMDTAIKCGSDVSDTSDEKCQHSDAECVRPGPRTPRSTNDFSKKTTMDLSDYFVGPRDINRHSKYPIPLRFCT